MVEVIKVMFFQGEKNQIDFYFHTSRNTQQTYIHLSFNSHYYSFGKAENLGIQLLLSEKCEKIQYRLIIDWNICVIVMHFSLF